MGPLDVVYHLLNFFAPAIVTGAVGAGALKVLWRQALRGVSWKRLAWRSGLAGALVLAAGLALWGRDGKMATYAAMVTLQALVAVWTGFGWGRR